MLMAVCHPTNDIGAKSNRVEINTLKSCHIPALGLGDLSNPYHDFGEIYYHDID